MALSLKRFEQEVWDYAQCRYNWTARRLNGLSDRIEAAAADERDPMEFVDDLARGGRGE